MRKLTELDIALAAMSDRVADEKHGVGWSDPTWKATKDAELKRLQADYEANGETSEVGKAIKRHSR
jgi:hypothetical protein